MIIKKNIMIAILLVIIAGCRNNKPYMIAFEKTIETKGNVVPDVRYNENGKAISLYLQYNNLDLFSIMAQEDKFMSYSDAYPYSNTYSYSNKYIPKAFAARSPEDVKYVVVVSSYLKIVSSYTNGAAAQRNDYEVEVLDLYPYSVVATKTFHGSEPPPLIHSSGGGIGSPPKEKDIQKFVEYVLTTTPEERERDAIESGTPPLPPPSSIIEKNADPNHVYNVTEQMPQFPAGAQALLKWINDNMKYPENAASNGIQGRVSCSFTVEKDGSISNIQIVEPVHPELDAEAIRVLKTLPKFIPGTIGGEVVRSMYRIPINFRLQQ